MNTALFTSLFIMLCSMLFPGKLSAELPSTNQVAQYERYDYSVKQWRSVSKTEGVIVLSSLRDIENFKRWGHDLPSGIFAHPIPTQRGFRIISTSGNTNTIYFSDRGELVSCQRGLLEIPVWEHGLLAELFTKWDETDHARIVSQPLPCNYIISSIDDGGTLSGVAKLFYGDAKQWRHIYEANKTTIKNPDIIRSGTVIKIPKLKETVKKKDSPAK